MRVIILGAGAGGGMPQWNGNSALNRTAFAGSGTVPRLTQCSIAASADGASWLLFNASPDMRQQILATPALHPSGPALRHSPIAAVFLTNADIDAVAGLLTLREGHAFDLIATPYVHGLLDENPVFEALSREKVRRVPLSPGEGLNIAGLDVTALALAGKPPLYAERRDGIKAGSQTGATIGFSISDPKGGRTVFLPSCVEIGAQLADTMSDADLLLFDGTLYTDEEMIAQGVGQKTSRRMGHMPMAGPDGSLARLSHIKAARKVYVHINNTNPVLDRTSPERTAIEQAGWEIGEDGMEFSL